MKLPYLAICILLLGGCERNIDPGQNDYRNQYTGIFSFTTIEKVIAMCYDSSSTCTDGWQVWAIDTNYFTSEISKYDSNNLKIQFGDGNFVSIGEISQVIYPEINLNAELTYQGDRTRNFKANLINKDSLQMSFEFSLSGMGGYFTYEISGSRKE